MPLLYPFLRAGRNKCVLKTRKILEKRLILRTSSVFLLIGLMLLQSGCALPNRPERQAGAVNVVPSETRHSAEIPETRAHEGAQRSVTEAGVDSDANVTAQAEAKTEANANANAKTNAKTNAVPGSDSVSVSVSVEKANALSDATQSQTDENADRPVQVLILAERSDADGRSEEEEEYEEQPESDLTSRSLVITVQQKDLLERIRSGFLLPKPVNNRVLTHLRFYQNHPDYIRRTLERSSKYLYFIVEEAQARNMPLEVALLPVVESAFMPFAYSHGQAAGLWQFIPGTGRHYGLKQNWWYDGRRDVVASTRAALDYLTALAKRFDGDWLLALAAYNAGQGNVNRAVTQNRRKNKPIDFWNLSLPKETEHYVPKLIALTMIIANPASFDMELQAIPDEPYFDIVDIGSQIDLALAAEMAGITLVEMYELNPGFNQWATDPEGPHSLLIPCERFDAFQAALDAYPEEKRIRWVRHRIESGQTLIGLAQRYQTTPQLLQEINKIADHRIRAGEYLMVPVALKSQQEYALTVKQRQAATQGRERNGHRITYVARPGDSLWEIAQRHKVSVRQLAKWNGMAPGDKLRVGRKLVIWEKRGSVGSQTAHARAASGGLPINTTHKVTYTVRNGDSLYLIAQRFKVSTDELIRWNSIKNPKLLKPGQRLTILVDVTQQS
jgi:membrane-bound lytic murein transglycosylase D